MKFLKNYGLIFLALLLILSFSNQTPGLTQPPLSPPALASGCFVDQYQKNLKANTTPDSNPSIALLSGFNQLWAPGATWDTGVKLKDTVLDANIQKAFAITNQRQSDAALMAYLDDRRNQSYSIIDGLGPYTNSYRTKAGAKTTIIKVAADATVKKYNDQGTGAGDESSSLGNTVRLVNTLRGGYSSTNPAKAFYKYPRPFRWSDQVVVLPELVPAKSATPETDGGYPSGHTNAGYLAAIALAYSVPERYQELLTRASELGHNRIVAGMHSPLDVMGGRMLATALAAAILNDPQNNDLKRAAFNQARTLTQAPATVDRFADYATNKKNYTGRLTYGFLPIDTAGKPMMVPKGAEVLLETRLPYLDGPQRRWVLFTTGLPSGYPILDDPEGWGRLNLFAAADGYGAFFRDTTVMMNAAKGGFHALDRWRNDISGPGMLIKAGSGTLQLAGDNTYSGGVRINGGVLEGRSATALGRGDVWVDGGALVSRASDDNLMIQGNYTQNGQGALQLHLGSDEKAPLRIAGTAKLDGKLILKFSENDIPRDGATLITCASRHGKFSSIVTQGLPPAYTVKVVYQANRVQVKIFSK